MGLRFRGFGAQGRGGVIRPREGGQEDAAEAAGKRGGRQDGEDQGKGEKGLHGGHLKTKPFRFIHVRLGAQGFKSKLNSSVQNNLGLRWCWVWIF